MAKSIKKNYVYQAAFQLFAILTPLITTPYISRVLKADGVGTASFVHSVVYNFQLFASMGISSYGRRETSYFQDNKEKRSWVFWNLKALAAVNIFISMTAFLVLTYIYAGDNYHLYLISGMNMINIFLDTSWLYAGMEEFRSNACWIRRGRSCSARTSCFSFPSILPSRSAMYTASIYRTATCVV